MASRTAKSSSASATLKMEQKLLAGPKAPKATKSKALKPSTKVADSPPASPSTDSKSKKSENADDEKKPRAPSAYNIFVKDNMAKVKSENPDVPHRECMALVAALWQKQKPADAPQTKPKKPRVPKEKKSKSDDGSSSDAEKPKKPKREPSAYNKHVGEAMKRLRADQPGLPSTEYMKLAIAEWKDMSEDDKPVSIKKAVIKKEPKRAPSEYNIFVRNCMQKLRADQPGLPSTDYMKLAVAEWKNHKETIKPEPEQEAEVVEVTKTSSDDENAKPDENSDVEEDVEVVEVEEVAEESSEAEESSDEAESAIA